MRTLGKKVLKLTLFTTLVSAAIALVFFLVIDPSTTAHSQLNEDPLQKSYFSYLLQIVPSNFIQPFLENNVVAVAFIALFLSLATLKLKQEQKKTLHQFFSAFFAALLKMTSAIITFIPIGIWAFMTLLVRDLYSETLHLEQILLYVFCIVGANLFQGIIVLPVLLKIKGISPLKTFRGMSKALFVAFFTKSPNAILPVAMKCAEENLNVSRKVSSFSFPLCSVINMNACAGFILITVLFASQSHGMQFSGLEYLLWIFMATIAAIGNAGVPMGCFFLASAFLSGMNVPLQFMGMILPFYALLDMLETGINVWSDSCITSIVDKEIRETEMVPQTVGEPVST